MGVRVASAAPSQAIPPWSESLTLDHYLNQVKNQNTGVIGSRLSSQAAVERSEEGKLLLAPTVFLNAQVTSDARIPQISFLQYESYVTKSVSLGVSKLTTFGLQAKFHYDLLSQYYVDPQLSPQFPLPAGGGNAPILFSFANASPVLELTQSLWGNGFGRATRATQDQIEAQALASSYASSFQGKTTLVQAETAYWRLALARESIQVLREALNRAKKLYDYSAKRARLHLADDSDALQAEAQVQARELELIMAQDEERSAAREFNSQRSVDSSEVNETLPSLSQTNPALYKAPERAEMREDVKASQQTARASVANSILSLERDSPTLEAFASLALNGQRSFQAFGDLSDSIPLSFSLNRPTKTVGLRFSAPIDLSVTSRTRSGWTREQIASEMNFDRKVFEQEQSWKNLNESLRESKKRLVLSQRLERIQKAKLENERRRLERGRSTTYQVLLFEQDYLTAELMRVRSQANVLTTLAQMKLFGVSS